MHDKHQIIEEPCEGKLSRTVLKTNVVGDNLVEFNTVAEVMAQGQGEAEISFQEELLKSGLAKTRLGGLECPNQIAFEQAQKIAIASKTGVWSQDKRN